MNSQESLLNEDIEFLGEILGKMESLDVLDREYAKEMIRDLILHMEERKDIGVFERVVQDIAMERNRQNEKWGEQNHDSYRWLAILTEEVGESAQAALHDEYGGEAAGTLEEELIQVVAVAVQWLECIKRTSVDG